MIKKFNERLPERKKAVGMVLLLHEYKAIVEMLDEIAEKLNKKE